MMPNVNRKEPVMSLFSAYVTYLILPVWLISFLVARHRRKKRLNAGWTLTGERVSGRCFEQLSDFCMFMYLGAMFAETFKIDEAVFVNCFVFFRIMMLIFPGDQWIPPGEKACEQG